MAPRRQQKAQARARRLAEERARAEQAQRQRRLRILAGAVVGAIVIVAAAVAISVSSGTAGPPPKPNSPAARQAAATVESLLSGIPQSDMTLGSPHAKVTLTEFGDLKCPICRAFALGPGSELIAKDVRTGSAKIVYRSLCTATCNGPQPEVFSTQQAAAMAAGLQNRAWYYIELFYHLQGDETTSYVTPNFLNGLATLVPGLDYAKWSAARGSSRLAARVSADQAAAKSLGFTGTPSFVVQGPKGTKTITSLGDYQTYESAIRAVE